MTVGRIRLYQSKRFDGVVGYRICLTHRRPPVRARVEPSFLVPRPRARTALYRDGHSVPPVNTMFSWLLVGALLTYAVLLPHFAASLGERAFPSLNSSALEDLANMRDPLRNLDPSDPYSHLQRILIPRPGTHIISFSVHLPFWKPIDWRTADTENHTLVRNYLVSTLRRLNWHVEEDRFVDSTPYGPKNFTNVIATKDPDAPRRVVLAAHFDSKFFPFYPENQACPIPVALPRRAGLPLPPSLTVTFV